MKKLLTFMALAILAIACKPEIVPSVEVISNDVTNIIPRTGGEITLTVNANLPWSASLKESGASSWCTLSPASGEAGVLNCKVIALENKETDNRSVTVVVTATNEKSGLSAKSEIVITQAQKDALIITGDKAVNVPFEGGEVKFIVDHNTSFEVAADVDWLTVVSTKAMEKSNVVFSAAPNKGAERVGNITVSSVAGEETIKVTQGAFVPKFEVAPVGDIWLAVEGGSDTKTIDANVEYEVAVGDNDWLTITNDKGVYTFKAAKNESYNYRSVEVTITPKDKALEESAVSFFVFQNGRATTMWTKNPATIEGYNVWTNARLAKYGDNIILANTNKVYVINPKDGAVVSSINIESFNANSVCVDDAGNIILANNALYGGIMNIVTVDNLTNPVLTPIAEWNTGNYYGVNVGNLRVKGDIKKEAVMTATVSAGAGGAAIIWQIENGVCADWKWVNVPYEAQDVLYGCTAPAGTKISDGLFYLGYGGDYNIKYLASPALNSGGNTWVTSYTTGYSWMENLNCFTTCEYNGKKYAAFTASCHFSYDDADAILLDITDPAKAELVYAYAATYDVVRNEDWSNTQFSNGGPYSDILLIPTNDGLMMVYIDTNFGSLGCILIK